MVREIESMRCQNGIKLLFELYDASIVEAAVFSYHGTEKDGIHICMPSQVGCPIGCTFCATTHSPLQYLRNLDAQELCQIIHHIQSHHSQFSKVDVISFSGHGEPLLNLNAIYKCLTCFDKSIKNSFITTVGIKKGIREIMENDRFVGQFFISLHGSTDLERSLVIPPNEMIANMYELSIFARYLQSTGKKVTFNYMLTQHNTTPKSAKHLADYLKKIGNVSIRFTPVFSEKAGQASVMPPTTDTFLSLFSHFTYDSTITWRISRPMGAEIGIACGQMRAQKIK